MRIHVEFFAQLRDATGTSELELDLRQGANARELLEVLYKQIPGLEKWDKNILLGAGLEFVGRDHVLRPNEEIAVMPPVQGG